MELSEKTKEYISVIQNELEQAGVLAETDKKNLEFLAEAVELKNRALDALDTGGMMAIDQHNRKTLNPAFTIVRSQQSIITSLLKELSISARQRRMMVKDSIISEETPLSKLMEII